MSNQPLQHRCPFCGERAYARTSRRVTSTYSTLYFRCGNTECGTTYVAGLEIVHTLSPSAYPAPPGVNIPHRPPARRPLRPAANDDDPTPLAANDAGLPTSARG